MVGVTGSVGKTSVKDIARALLPGRVHANRENLNTEIGLPLTVLEAPDDTETLVLEMAMRGAGQIAELAAIAEPEVAVITNVGPVHVELLGSVEAIAAAKAEMLDALPPDGTAVAPVEAGELEPHLERAPRLLRFGPGGDVEATEVEGGRGRDRGADLDPGRRPALPLPLRRGAQPDQRPGRDRRRRRARRAAGGDGRPRCEHRILPLPRRAPRARRRDRPRERLLQRQPGVDARGARPSRHASGRRGTVAVLGEMGELGPGAPGFHREVGEHARAAGVDLRASASASRPATTTPTSWSPTPAEAAELLAAHLRARRRRPRQGLALGRPRGRRRALASWSERWRLMGEVLIAGMAAMLICIFLGPKFIEYLRVREFGQHIREDGPQEHHAKAGTPTMGGLIVFASICVPYLVLSDRDAQSLAVFGVALGCAAIGFADDFIKIVKRRSLGLSARWKLLFQVILALVLWWVARHEVGLEPILYFRIGDASLDLGPVLYFVLVFLVIAGTSNGVNLTDGLDGLAAGSCAIVLLAYTAIAFVANEQQDLALLSACLVGACIGFLWFNAFPASIFMGDTGSLGLGGAIGALAVMTQTEVLLIIIGGIFVIEALSVAIQVFSFKTFRRRVLLMAPLHHHFEMMAWSETKIMLRFWIIAAVCSGIGFTLYQQSIGR